MNFFNVDSVTRSFEKVKQSVDRLDKTVVYKAAEAHKLALCAFLDRKTLYVCGENAYLDACEQFSQMGVSVVTLDPVYDVVTHRVGVNMSSVGKRISSLVRLSKGDYDVLVVTPKVLLQYLPCRQMLEKGFFTLREGDEIEEDELEKRLSSLGYKRRTRAEEKGDYAVIGEVFELFPGDG